MTEFQKFDIDKFEDTAKYGFVIDHPAYWGIPIPGFPPDRQPAQPTDPVGVPSSLTVSNPSLSSSSGWTGGNISVLATRTPPLFHAFHHKTEEALAAGGHGGHGGNPFERRAERNIVERAFSPRSHDQQNCSFPVGLRWGRRGPLRGIGRVLSARARRAIRARLGDGLQARDDGRRRQVVQVSPRADRGRCHAGTWGAVMRRSQIVHRKMILLARAVCGINRAIIRRISRGVYQQWVDE